MRQITGKKRYIIFICVFITFIMNAELIAAPGRDAVAVETTPAASIPEATGQSQSEIVTTQGYEKLTITELYEKVKSSRQEFLETRSEVVKKANEAKQRLEELVKGNWSSGQSADALRKDLDTVKEAQRVLATILSDIVNATSGSDADADTAKAAAATGIMGGSGQAFAGNETGSGNSGTMRINPGEILPSREYIEKLIILYSEKNQQLVKIAGSLDGIVTVRL